MKNQSIIRKKRRFMNRDGWRVMGDGIKMMEIC
jgi:hypothetical protein